MFELVLLGMALVVVSGGVFAMSRISGTDAIHSMGIALLVDLE